MESAEDLFNTALKIFHKEQHPDIFIVLENLGELKLKQLASIDSNSKSKGKALKDKATAYLRQARDIIRSNFSEESEHRTRINKILSILNEET